MTQIKQAKAIIASCACRFSSDPDIVPCPPSMLCDRHLKVFTGRERIFKASPCCDNCHERQATYVGELGRFADDIPQWTVACIHCAAIYGDVTWFELSGKAVDALPDNKLPLLDGESDDDLHVVLP